MVLVAVVLVAFLPALAGGFAPLDDDQNFVYNPAYRGLGLPQLGWMFTTRHLGHYIPLSWMSLGLDYLVWGMDPFGYHLTSVLLHLLNALLCFELARRLLRRAANPPDPPEALPADDRARTAGAFAAALVFAVHPLRVESVAWITERRDVLCGCFVFVTVLLYVAMTEAVGRRRRQLFGGSCLAYAAALLAKGIAVALPVSLLALDATMLRRWRWGRARPDSAISAPGEAGGRRPGRWGLVVEKIPYLVLAAAGAAVTLWASRPVRAADAGLSLGARLAAAAYGLTFYLRATLAPVRLPFFIPWPEEVGLARPEFGLRAVLFVLLLALCWALRRRFPALLAAALSYAAWVLPVSGLFQAGPQLAAHRYSYLSCVPWALLAGAGIARLARAGADPAAEAGPLARMPPLAPLAPMASPAPAVPVVPGGRLLPRRIVVAICLLAAATAFLAVATRQQVLLWRSAQSFSRAAAASAPEFWLTRYQRAHSEVEAGHWQEAASEVDAGLIDTPDACRLAALGALMYATTPDPAVRDGQVALDLATQAVEAGDPPDQFSLYALAAAQAETGDFAAAARTARQGLDRPDADADVPLGRRFAAAIVLFKQRKPLRFGPADWPY